MKRPNDLVFVSIAGYFPFMLFIFLVLLPFDTWGKMYFQYLWNTQGLFGLAPFFLWFVTWTFALVRLWQGQSRQKMESSARSKRA